MSPTSEGWGASDHTEDPVTNKSIDKEVELRSKGRVYRAYISTEVAMYKESLRNHK